MASFFRQAPSVEDLTKLYELCGGDDDQVIAHLAKLFGLPPEAIASTVRTWLKMLPAVPPPSRQRSAPAVMAAEVGPLGVPKKAGMGSQMVKIQPPASAPVPGREVIAAMRALDSRINKTNYSMHGNTPWRMQRANDFRSAFQQPEYSVPEDHAVNHMRLDHVWSEAPRREAGTAVADHPAAASVAVAATSPLEFRRLIGNHGGSSSSSSTNDKNLEAYLERQAIVHGQGKLAPAQPGSKVGGTSSTWMTRAIRPAI